MENRQTVFFSILTYHIQSLPPNGDAPNRDDYPKSRRFFFQKVITPNWDDFFSKKWRFFQKIDDFFKKSDDFFIKVTIFSKNWRFFFKKVTIFSERWRFFQKNDDFFKKFRNRLNLGQLPQIGTIAPNRDDFFSRLSSRFGSKDCIHIFMYSF